MADEPGLPSLPYAAGLQELRYTLLPSEIDRYRLLGRDCAEVVEDACWRLERGRSERHAAGMIAQVCYERGILPLVLLVAADERIAQYRHPIPTEHPVCDKAMLVLTGRRQGLHVSLTRLMSFGTIEDELRRRHRAATAVDAALIAGSRPGRKLGEILDTGIRRYEEEGFAGEWERHHQGGLTGYAGREIFATPSARHVLGPGQALAWNPSITGTKSEDTILLGADGFEVLSRSRNWPSLSVSAEGQTIERPDILTR